MTSQLAIETSDYRPDGSDDAPEAAVRYREHWVTDVPPSCDLALWVLWNLIGSPARECVNLELRLNSYQLVKWEMKIKTYLSNTNKENITQPKIHTGNKM